MNTEEWPDCPVKWCEYKVCLWAGTGKCFIHSKQEIGGEKLALLYRETHPGIPGLDGLMGGDTAMGEAETQRRRDSARLTAWMYLWVMRIALPYYVLTTLALYVTTILPMILLFNQVWPPWGRWLSWEMRDAWAFAKGHYSKEKSARYTAQRMDQAERQWYLDPPESPSMEERR